MARVKAGPLVSGIRGSVGPVTYYEMLGKQIVRARVRPHQKISSARYANRQQWKLLMSWWSHTRFSFHYYWQDAAANEMHGVNLFIRQNRPVVTTPAYLWPRKDFTYPAFTIRRQDLGANWKIWYSWNPADYPTGWKFGVAYAGSGPYFYGWQGNPLTSGHMEVTYPKKADATVYTALGPPGTGGMLSHDYHQLQRALVADLPPYP